MRELASGGSSRGKELGLAAEVDQSQFSWFWVVLSGFVFNGKRKRKKKSENHQAVLLGKIEDFQNLKCTHLPDMK